MRPAAWPEVAVAGPPDDPIWLTCLTAPPGDTRRAARERVREALHRLLQDSLGIVTAQLIDAPGQPLRLSGQPHGIAVSHDPGLSLLALRPAGPVGVDVMAWASLPTSPAERDALARDFLGMTVTLSETAFAEAWTAHEARLKCLGQPLGEWTVSLGKQLAACHGEALVLPAGFAGHCAWLPRNAQTPG